jgi:hypothetical protein
MNEPLPCPICKKTIGCNCASQFGPFELYDSFGEHAGSFVHVALAFCCLAVLEKHVGKGAFKPSLIDRWGCPLKINFAGEVAEVVPPVQEGGKVLHLLKR